MKIVSLFSGAGGLDLGLTQAGHEIIWANDHDKDAVETYKYNIGNHIIEKDIEKINLSEIPPCDVVVGGFPCQGFSLANTRRSTKDNRNKLYVHFLRIVTAKKPLYFLAENVRGILSLGKGKIIRKIVNDFENAGYRVKYHIFNVADYGVPQMRKRVIIAGTRKDLPQTLDYVFPAPTHTCQKLCSLNNRLTKWITIEEALMGIPEPDTFHKLHNHIYSKYKITNRNFTGHRRTNPKLPSPTILARGNGQGGVCAIQHPLNHRRLSVRESAIIQTFPLEYGFCGSMNSCYRQVGNAVPVLFAFILGKELKLLEVRNKSCA
ncbi:MAG: DNA cytosine methyltransferase [Candidatus Saganbacteria bacterium]|nr:DNA cytosine methyltransferase [Candidatus Saganbacteria bacterium]